MVIKIISPKISSSHFKIVMFIIFGNELAACNNSWNVRNTVLFTMSISEITFCIYCIHSCVW
jgi:hypothetical protein